MSERVTRLLTQFGHLARPHYVFNPRQAARRLAIEFKPLAGERRTRLPWGATIAYDPREAVGSGIARCGVFDLLVCEALLRLVDPGETALDVGANIGQMASVLAYAVGSSGRVLAFEPHPVVFERLTRNAQAWRASGLGGPIDLHQVALSDRDGTAVLSARFFDANQGSASLETDRALPSPGGPEVPVRSLDAVIGAKTAIGVMKMDIEGHELHALRGAEAVLSSRRVRDIVFEERSPPPTPVTNLLQQRGYVLFRIEERLRGPRLVSLGLAGHARSGGEDPSLLATQAPERALQRFEARGWRVYRARSGQTAVTGALVA